MLVITITIYNEGWAVVHRAVIKGYADLNRLRNSGLGNNGLSVRKGKSRKLV